MSNIQMYLPGGLNITRNMEKTVNKRLNLIKISDKNAFQYLSSLYHEQILKYFNRV